MVLLLLFQLLICYFVTFNCTVVLFLSSPNIQEFKKILSHFLRLETQNMHTQRGKLGESGN